MKIKEFCIINNSTISPKVDCEILYLDTSSITNNEIEGYQSFMLSKAPSRAQRKVQDKTILYSCVRPNLRHFGILKNPPSNLVVSTGFATLDVKDECVVDPYYLYYWLSQESITNTLHTIAQNAVSSYPSINPSDIGDLEIDLPPINIQRKIGAFLDSLDRKISLNRSINAELERMAKEIYDYWFVQFEFPDANGRPYKSSGGAMVYNPVLKREVPQGWEVVKLIDIANITMGQSPDGSSYNEDGDGIIFYQGSTDFGMRFPDIRKYTTAPTRYASKGDILMSVRAPVGAVNIANNDCCIGRGLAALNSKIDSQSHLFYVIADLKTAFDQRNAAGTTFGSITKDDLYSLPVVKPSNDVISSFEKLCSPIFDRLMLLGEETVELTNKRDELLPLLMTGQVKIK